MGINVSSKGDFAKTDKLLKRVVGRNYLKMLDRYGQLGVQALATATPKDTGATAASWTYQIQEDAYGVSIVFDNTNIINNQKIAILIQYGHGNRNGGFVRGRDYINPSVRPVFDELAEAAWKEVTKS